MNFVILLFSGFLSLSVSVFLLCFLHRNFHFFCRQKWLFLSKKVKPINLHWFWEDVLGMPRVACQIDFLSRARSSEWKITRWQATSGIPTHQFPKSMEVRGLFFFGRWGFLLFFFIPKMPNHQTLAFRLLNWQPCNSYFLGYFWTHLNDFQIFQISCNMTFVEEGCVWH